MMETVIGCTASELRQSVRKSSVVDEECGKKLSFH